VPDPIRRYQLLTKKLGTYVNYVASPEFAQQYPDLPPDAVRIWVVCSQPPNEAMSEIQAVRPRGNGGRRVPVVFESWAAFEQRLGRPVAPDSRGASPPE